MANDYFDAEIVDDDEGQSSGPLAVSPAGDAMAIAMVDTQITTAKRYPRNLDHFKRRLLQMVTIDSDTAEECAYSLERKGKDGKVSFITGPTIRMAEIVQASYQNMKVGSRFIGESPDGRSVIVEAFAWDLENNVAVSAQVVRQCVTRAGKKYSADMMATTINAGASIARRNAVFSVVPRAMIRPAFNAARQLARGETKSLQVRRGEVLDRLMKLCQGVGQDRILERLGKRAVAEIDWEDIDVLLGIGTAIKSGEKTVEYYFPEVAAQGGGEASDAAASLAAAASSSKPAAAQRAAARATEPAAEPEAVAKEVPSAAPAPEEKPSAEVEPASAEKPSERAPAGPVRLDEETIGNIRAACKDQSVDYGDLEEAMGGPLGELEGDVVVLKRQVMAAIRRLAAVSQVPAEPAVLDPAKVESILAAGKGVGFDEAALDAFCQHRWGVNLRGAPAASDTDIYRHLAAQPRSKAK